VACAFVALFFGLGWALRARAAGRALIPVGIILFLFLLAVHIGGPLFLLAPATLWRPLFCGLLIAAGSVALYVALERKWGSAKPEAQGPEKDLGSDLSLGWEELDEDQQDVLRLLSQQRRQGQSKQPPVRRQDSLRDAQLADSLRRACGSAQ